GGAERSAAPPVDRFTAEERELLAPFFTNTDRPVFALRNLPEVVKGALFARYSRSAKSLRRLFLDEFAEGAAELAEAAPGAGEVGAARATRLYERVFDDYGDDSVAQLGGAHVACEQVSNVLTKVLEWGRLAAYLEQSTRYVSYADRRAGGYRYHVDPAVDAHPLGPEYRRVLDGLFGVYADCLPLLVAHLEGVAPRDPGASEPAWRRALKARALDGLRGLLPAATTANVGIFASGQAYEALLLRLRAHPLPEARACAELLLTELREVIPAFLTRVDRPDRGGAWSAYLAGTADRAREAVASLLGEDEPPERGPAVRLVAADPDAEDRVLAAIAVEHGRLDWASARERVARLPAAGRARLLDAYTGERGNRRHRPGRAFEQALYTFEVVSDYGAFRDLQRHRLCTITWQPLSPRLGYEVPADVDAAGLGERFRGAMRASAALHDELAAAGFGAQAPYAVSLAHRVRFTMTMNARELLHVAELRSGPQGHPAYRAVARELHRLVAEQAGHRLLAGAMRFVDHGDAGLGRLAAEQRLEARRAARQPT
ncbi:MAG TPA: FAD-dependent thymidylate synthase, partial [Actinomycetes bacterium]|nr:FAD-dependent thymidylate synthase [Actinomycetes bacterium]